MIRYIFPGDKLIWTNNVIFKIENALLFSNNSIEKYEWYKNSSVHEIGFLLNFNDKNKHFLINHSLDVKFLISFMSF